jgi:hypothetical protein
LGRVRRVKWVESDELDSRVSRVGSGTGYDGLDGSGQDKSKTGRV